MTNPSGETCKNCNEAISAQGGRWMHKPHSGRKFYLYCGPAFGPDVAAPVATPTPPQPFGEIAHMRATDPFAAEREMVAKGAVFVPIGNMRALLAALDAANERLDRELVHMGSIHGGALCGRKAGYGQHIRLTDSYSRVVCQDCFVLLLDAKTAEVERLKKRRPTAAQLRDQRDSAFRFIDDLGKELECAYSAAAAERDRAAEYAEAIKQFVLVWDRDDGTELDSIYTEEAIEELRRLSKVAPDGTTARARVKVLETFLLWIRNEYNASPYLQSQIDSVLEPSS